MLLEQVPMSGNENKESSRAALKGVTIIRRQLPRPASAKTSTREWIGRKKGRASEACTACTKKSTHHNMVSSGPGGRGEKRRASEIHKEKVCRLAAVRAESALSPRPTTAGTLSPGITII